ncbi:MAG: DivIVA domain-containing protein [Candidatus Tectomicrobia bacterium]|uniref:DivIVA domain-containing protein n=1 Tax=Tectimicrobiota bacterium TaxID=2528274 RepID=A0A932GMR3_UNCTE|nr:DivIVA domain-containing protein [Candidatus Tectomicrobia bacterium]
MKITPLDIRQQQFGVKFRGFDPAEVDAFLDMVATEMEEIIQERDSFRDQLERRQQDLAEYKERERDLQKSLSAVQQVRESLTEGATREAQLIVEEAKQRTAEMITKAEEELGKIRAEVHRLQGLKKTFEIRLRSTLDSFQKMLELDEAEVFEEPGAAGEVSGKAGKRTAQRERSPAGASAEASDDEREEGFEGTDGD